MRRACLQDRCYVTVRPDPLAAGKVTFCQKTKDASELYFHAAVVRQKVRDARASLPPQPRTPSPDDRTPLPHTPHMPRMPPMPHSTTAVSLSQVTRLLKEKFKLKQGFFENGKLKRHTRLAEKCFFRADDPCAAPPAAAQHFPRKQTEGWNSPIVL